MVRGAWVAVLVVVGVMISEGCWAGVYNRSGQVLQLPSGGTLSPGEPNYSYIKRLMQDQGLLPMAVAIPAKVAVEGTVGKVSKWAQLAVTSAPASVITKVAIEGTLLVGSVLLGEWVESKGWSIIDGLIHKPSGTGAYIAGAGSPGVGEMTFVYGGNTYNVFLYPNATAATEAAQAAGGQAFNYSYTTLTNNGWSATYWGKSAYNTRVPISGNPCTIGYYLYPQNGASVVWQDSPAVAVTGDEIEDEVKEDLDRTDDVEQRELSWELAQEAVESVGPAVYEANQEWPNTVPDDAGYDPLTAGEGAEVQTALNDSIPAAVKDDLGADGNSTTANYPVQRDWEYTPEQMAAAQLVMDKALDDYRYEQFVAGGGNDDNGSDNSTGGTYSVPDRKDLGGLLVSFGTSMAALPVVSVVQNSGVTVDGAISYIDLPKPDIMGGGTVRVDFADYESWLIGFGNLLYAFVGFHWLMWLFMGRGDA